MGPQEKNDKLKQITDELEKGIAELCDSERYKDYLKTMSKFYHYSINNSILIWKQLPEATAVAGYNAWKEKFGRQVKKGEKGISIIVPCSAKSTREIIKIDPVTMKPIYDENGNPVTEKARSTAMRFKAAAVFDISQTEGKPLPEVPVNELNGDVENYRTMLQALIQAAPCPVRFGDPGSGAYGCFSRGTQSITIREEMSQQQTLETLIHEIGHAILHADQKEALQLTRGTREVEAESVAYTVCSHYGIDTSAYSFGYVAAWSQGKELQTLRESLDTIRNTAVRIIDRTDEQLELIQSHTLSPNLDTASNIAMRLE